MKKTAILSFSILALIIAQVIIIPGIQFTGMNTYDQLNLDEHEGFDDIDTDFIPDSSASDEEWWDETYMYRIPLILTEPGVMTRVKECVTIELTFETNTHRWNSTRLVSNETGSWVLNSFQLSDIVNQTGDIFIQSFKIHFLVSVVKSATAYFWLYYSEDNLAPYSQTTVLSDTITENLVTIDNGYYQLELTKGQAYTRLQFKDEATNLHSTDSLMPTRIASTNYTKTYSPDANGYIRDWLLIGPFPENPSWNLHESGPSIRRYQLDIKRDWAAGENASGGTAQTAYSNPNKRWTIHHDSDNTIDLNYIYSNPPSSSGAPDDVVAYAMCYVHADYDLNNIYIKLASDDAVAVVMDNDPDAPTWEDYVQRGLGTDQSIWGPFNMSKGWHSFLVFVNERGGAWSFRMRFSTSPLVNTGNIVTPLKISLVPPTKIVSFSKLESGPIYNKYLVEWTDTADVKIWDTFTVFAGATKAWKCERTFWWGKIRSSPTNSSFGIVNTLYPNPLSTYSFDDYLYPLNNEVNGLANDEFTSENYTVIQDNDGSPKSLGIYISDIETGPGMSLNNIDWFTMYYDDVVNDKDRIDIIPGYTTDLNKPLYFSSYSSLNAKYNATITFWEYLNKTTSFSVVNDTYLALKNPINIVNGSIKHLYYELDVHCIDHDTLNAKGVTLTVINATDGTGWDYDHPTPISDTTDDGGNVHFIRLKEGYYTVNITYTNYGHTPIFLDSFNVTLDQSKSVTAPVLGLTTLAINLQKYEEPMPALPQNIINANVSFYSGENIDPAYYIGSIFSDAYGFVSFVWLNQSSSVMNYSFKVEFLGDRRDINETLGGPKDHITVPMESFTSLTVSVHVQDFTTFLNLETGDTMVSNYYGDNLLVNVSYWFSLGTTNTRIGAATVSYTLRRSTLVIDQGTFTPSGPSGYYAHYIDTAALGMLAGQSYTLAISAEKSGYTRADNTTFITLLYLPMELTPDESVIEINWLENITFGIRLEDTYNIDWISDATMTYEVSGIPSISGSLIRDLFRGFGWYNLTLNSTEFPNYGSYTLSVRATKTNYAQAIQPISIVIRQIRTLINGTIFLPKQFEIFVGTVQIFHFNYTDSDGRGISNADLPSWELQRLNDQGQVISGMSGNLIETSQIGVYAIDGLDTSMLPVGRYSIVVRISVTNYVERQSALSLTIKQITIQMTEDITGVIYSRPKGTDINISISIFDPVSLQPLGTAEVNITYRGQTLTMTRVGTSGVYYHIIYTESYDVLAQPDTFGAVITITVNENYTFSPVAITIQVMPPLGPLGIPMIYWLIGSIIGGVAIGAFVTAKAVSYARIPMMVKDVQATMKVIKKNGKFSNTKIARSPDEILEQDSEAEYASLGLSLKGKLTSHDLPTRSTDDVNEIERRSD